MVYSDQISWVVEAGASAEQVRWLGIGSLKIKKRENYSIIVAERSENASQWSEFIN
jgi:hypothetical protein